MGPIKDLSYPHYHIQPIAESDCVNRGKKMVVLHQHLVCKWVHLWCKKIHKRFKAKYLFHNFVHCILQCMCNDIHCSHDLVHKLHH